MAETGFTTRFSSSVSQKGGITQKQSKQRQLPAAAASQLPQGSLSNRGGIKLTQQYEKTNINNNLRIGLVKESQGWSYESSQSTNANTGFDYGSDSSKHNSKSFYKKTTTSRLQFEYPSSSSSSANPPLSESSRLDLLRVIYMKKLHTRLYEKFSQSQNYYYTRDVSDLLAGNRTSFTIKQKDQITIDEQEEYLKRMYQLKEYPLKIKLLTEYYKFHTDIPRLFMQNLASIMNHMHDKKRRIEFYRIAKLIDEENKKNPTKPPKGIVGDIPAPRTEESVVGKKEKETGKNLDKGLSCLLEDISSFINKTTNIDKNKKQIKGQENTQEDVVLMSKQYLELQRQQITAQRLKLERMQLQELKEKQLKQLQRMNKLSQNNNNNNEISLSVMNSRLREMLQISKMSQSIVQSESIIQDISENHGLDDFLNFLNKQQSSSFTGSQGNIINQNTKSGLKSTDMQILTQQSQQLTLLSASQQISLKISQPSNINNNNNKNNLGSQQNQQYLQQQQQSQKCAFTRTVVASLQEKTNNIQFCVNLDGNIQSQVNQQEQQTPIEYNQQQKQSPRVIRHAQQQQKQEQQQQPQQFQTLNNSLTKHLQNLCQVNNLTNSNNEQVLNSNPMQAPKTTYQSQQSKQTPSISSSNSTNQPYLTKNQNPQDLKLNLFNLNQTLIRSGANSLKNSFGGNNNNNSNSQQNNNTSNKIAYSIINADTKKSNRDNDGFQNTSNSKQQQLQRGGTASSEETMQQSSSHRGLQLQIVQGVANAQNLMSNYPLTSRIQNNSRNHMNFNTNTPRSQMVSKEQNNPGLSQQEQQQFMSSGSTQHSRQVSTYKTSEQQQQQQQDRMFQSQGQQQQLQSNSNQQDRMIASQGQQQKLQSNNNNNNNSNQVSSGNQQQTLQQYQQQFKISKLKKNSINSLHLFSTQQQLISPRTSGGAGEVDNQIDHIPEHNTNNNNNNNPTITTAIASSLSTRNISNAVKAQSSVNTPTNASNNSSSKQSQMFTFNGLTSSNVKEPLTSSGKNQPTGSVPMSSTMSSFRQLNNQNNNNNNQQQNLINSPQGSQHSIQLQAQTAQQQQQQSQQFNSFLRTASTGFNGNLLLQPTQSSAYIANSQSNNPSGSVSARNQLSSSNSMHLRQRSNPTTGLTKNSQQSSHRFNSNSNNNSNNLNSAKTTSENIYSQHNQDYFQNSNASPPNSLPVSQTLHTNSNIGSPRSMNTTKLSFFGSTTRTRPSLQSNQQLQIFIQDPQQQQQQQQQVQQSKQPNPQHSHKYTKSEAQGMLTQSHTFFQAQEYNNNTPSSAFQAFNINNTNSLASLTERSKLQSKSQQQSAAFGQFQQHQQPSLSSGQFAMQSNQTGGTKLIAVNQNTPAKQMLAQHASQGITLPQSISSSGQQHSQQQQQQPYQLSSNNNNNSSHHTKNVSPRQQLAFPLSKV